VFATEDNNNEKSYLNHLTSLSGRDEIWAILPIELGDIGKREERHTFFARLHSVLQTLTASREIAGTFIICHNLDVLAIARTYGARTFQNNSNIPQPQCIRNISSILRIQGARSILSMSVHSILITDEHIQGMIHLGRYSYTAVLAPTRDDKGTQAFLLKPPACVLLEIGAGSFKHNTRQAEHAQLRIAVYAPESIQFMATGAAQAKS